MTTTATASVEWRVPLDHPAFEGHFPGLAVVPGVLLIAQALEVAAAKVDPAWLRGPVQIAQTKFLAPLRPGDGCTIALHGDVRANPEASPSTRLRFEIRRGDVLAATGVLERQPA